MATLLSQKRGAEVMKQNCRLLYTALASIVVVLLIFGAGNETAANVTTDVASSITSTATTTNVISRPIGSIKSKITIGPASGLTSSTTSSIINKENGNQIQLSPREEELAKTLMFDRRVLYIVIAETQEKIHRLIGFDENEYQIITLGVTVKVPKENTDRVLSSLRKKLIPLGYMPFVVEKNSAFKIDKIGVIKSTDQYEILRIMHTDGDEYEISNQDVIDRLKDWEKLASFSIIGADNDWVEIEFTKLPKDLKSFAEEVSEFSPDTLELGPKTVKGLIEEIKKTNRLRLSWE